MRCWNCGEKVPDSAKTCPACEADMSQTPTPEQEQAVREMLEQMDPEMRQQFMELARSSKTADEFANAIFVGACPTCGSENTQDCDNDPEIENPLVGRCLDCGTYWCTWCDSLLDKNKLECPCWEEEIDLPGMDESEAEGGE